MKYGKNESMRRMILLLSLILALAPLALAPVAVTGCATPSKEVTYQTLRTVAISVDAARKTYADAIVRGEVSDERQVEIDKLITRYQAAMNTAITAAQFDYEQAAPAELATLAAQIITIVTTLNQTQT
ncbi:hypothetical protein [Thiocapsa sp. N5-Cardenillas]|uniref:hypothetical protein n=1 Tax=Thiocapsa sp. N5-Cardenillas TaxID=3137397 RepID=UPI0035B49076